MTEVNVKKQRESFTNVYNFSSTRDRNYKINELTVVGLPLQEISILQNTTNNWNQEMIRCNHLKGQKVDSK